MKKVAKTLILTPTKQLLLGLIVAVLFVAAYMVGNNTTAQQKPSVAQSVRITSVPKTPSGADMLHLVNAERSKHGAEPLVEDPELDASAQYKASDMLNNNYFGHVSPQTNTQNGLDYMVKTVGNRCTYVSENLTENPANINTSAEAVGTWIISTPHHQAMIDTKYTLTGFGIAGRYIVEDFCQQ